MSSLTIKFKEIIYMKKNILNSYSTPTFAVYEVEVDKGFAISFETPGMGSEGDEIEFY